MIRLFVGHDPREEVGSHVFVSSVLQHASCPVQITHLHTPALEGVFGKTFAQGSNAFTASRFLVAALCDFAGPPAVFVDGADMLCRTDIAKIVESASKTRPVSVVKHVYKTKNKTKYRGTLMECENRDYERKQWASVMVINPWHYAWRRLTPDKVAETPLLDLLQFKFLEDEQIADLPMEWNWLADEYGRNEDAKLLHWTAGVPGFPYYANSAHAEEWHAQLKRTTHATW